MVFVSPDRAQGGVYRHCSFGSMLAFHHASPQPLQHIRRSDRPVSPHRA